MSYVSKQQGGSLNSDFDNCGIRKPADLPVTNILRAVLAITAFAFPPLIVRFQLPVNYCYILIHNST